MTLKMEPKLIKMQVFYEKHIITVRLLPLYSFISTPKHVTKFREKTPRRVDHGRGLQGWLWSLNSG